MKVPSKAQASDLFCVCYHKYTALRFAKPHLTAFMLKEQFQSEFCFCGALRRKCFLIFKCYQLEISVTYALRSLLQFRKTIRYTIPKRKRELHSRVSSPGAPGDYSRLSSVFK